jgi:transcriptional regulator with XRE-family HTH domain
VVPPNHRKRLGEALRRCRQRAGLSQEALAEKADLSPKYVGEVERGLVNISVDSLLRLANALAVRVRDLVADF